MVFVRLTVSLLCLASSESRRRHCRFQVQRHALVPLANSATLTSLVMIKAVDANDPVTHAQSGTVSRTGARNYGVGL
jgi:hypothetical protein